MLKQGVVQETLGDLNPLAPLPPLNNLPQWSRINTLDKARYPKPFLKDRYQPLPLPHEVTRGDSSGSSEDQDLDLAGKVNPMQRIQHLEKSLLFLRTQHQEILASLHEEIDKLKRENKELQFRLVMLQKTSSPSESGSPVKGLEHFIPTGQPSFSHSAKKKENRQRSAAKSSNNSARVAGRSAKPHSATVHSAHGAGHSRSHDDSQDLQSEQHSQGSDEKLEELKVIFLEEEISNLKQTLQEEKSRNAYLTNMLDLAQKQDRNKQSQNHLGIQHGPYLPHPPRSPKSHVEKPLGGTVNDTPVTTELPYQATVNPLLVHSPNKPARPPNLAECEVIIKYLQQLNDRQAHELSRLKSDLRDVLYSHKWTPDAYLLAKAYIAEDDAKEAAEQNRLPRIQLKQPTRKLPDLAYISKDTMTLPALKQTMGNKAAERRKRQQTLQKSRTKHELGANISLGEGNHDQTS